MPDLQWYGQCNRNLLRPSDVGEHVHKNLCREISDVGARHSLLSVKIPRGAHCR